MGFIATRIITVILTLVSLASPALGSSADTADILIPDELKQRFPDAQFQIVPLDDLNVWSREGSLVITQTQSTPFLLTSNEINQDLPKLQDPENTNCDPNCLRKDAGDWIKIIGSIPMLGLLYYDTSGWNTLLISISGSIYAVAMIYYAGKYVHDTIVDKAEFLSWLDFSVSSALLSNGILEGGVYGVKAKTGLSEKYSNLGFAVEFGKYDIKNKESTYDKYFNGGYWLAGPTISIFGEHHGDKGLSGVSIDFDILAGRSLDKQVGKMATMRMELNFEFNKHYRAGVALGALYTDFQKTYPALEGKDQYTTTAGITVGYKF